MIGELIEPFLTWKVIVAFLTINVLLLLYHFDIVKNCLTTQATGKTKYVLVTGCDRGIGYKTALELNAERKVKVFAGCLTQDGVNRLKDYPAFKGIALLMDVTKEEDVSNAYKLITENVGDEGLWCVVSNAGILQPGIIEWQSIKDMRKPMEVNLWGAINVIKTMLPLVKKAKGRFVNVTSMAGRVWFGCHTAYSMSKFAFEGFSDGLRHEMKQWGISVHIIEPGMFATPILEVESLEKSWEELWSQQSEKTKTDYGRDYFTKTLNNIKDMISTLASPNIKKVTDAICHATLSSNPHRRYVVGVDGNTIWMAIATLPTFIGDFIAQSAAKAPTPAAMMVNKVKT